MDSLVTMIVDILRRKEETEALNRGGPLAPSAQNAAAPPPPQMAPAGAGPRGKEPLHGNKTIDQILAEQGG